MASEAQIKANKENAKKAGRKKGSKAAHTLQSIAFKKYLIRRVEKEKKPIIDALIAAAKEKNVPAIKEIFERALGREQLPIDFKANDLKQLADAIKALAKK